MHANRPRHRYSQLRPGSMYCGARHTQGRLAGHYPVRSLQKTIARAEFGITETAPRGAVRRSNVDTLQAGIEDTRQVVGDAIFDVRLCFELAVARYGREPAAVEITGRGSGGDTREPLPGALRQSPCPCQSGGRRGQKSE